MPIQILMPALASTTRKGRLARWLVREGDRVRAGDVIAEIETDTVTMEVEAVDGGRVARILVAAGTGNVSVDTPIAVLIGDDEPEPAFMQSRRRPVRSPGSDRWWGTPRAPDNDRLPPEATHVPLRSGVGDVHAAQDARTPDPTVPIRERGAGSAIGGRRDATAAPASDRADVRPRVHASPLARRLAREWDIELSAIAGTGPGGRIVKHDVEAHSQQRVPSAGATSARPAGALVATAQPHDRDTAARPDAMAAQIYQPGSYAIEPHDARRLDLARRLELAQQHVPLIHLSIDCRLDQLLGARSRLNLAAPPSGPRAYKLSLDGFLIKALALALQQVPAANAIWTSRGMMRHRGSDIGVAMATDHGVQTPILRHAELKSLSEISAELRELTERARLDRLAAHECHGGTTSIANLGAYGIRRFDPIVSPPHATVLAVGAGERRPIAIGSSIEIATMMSCTLACDRRVIDGALGAELLAAFKGFVEDPVRMLV